MKKYRISKYNPALRDDEGRYTANDWTSYSDIGKLYNGKILDASEYQFVENKYIQSIMMILENKAVNSLLIKGLEKYFDTFEIENMLKEYKLTLSRVEKDLFHSIKNESHIAIDNIKYLVKLILRECLWCILETTPNDIVLEFGYDYYMYISCESLSQDIMDNIQSLQLYIDEIDWY